MLAKVDSYWNEVHNIVSLTIVLHLTHKFMLLKFYFDKIFGYKANKEIDKWK